MLMTYDIFQNSCSIAPSAMLYTLHRWSRDVVTTTGSMVRPQCMLVIGKVW